VSGYVHQHIPHMEENTASKVFLNRM